MPAPVTPSENAADEAEQDAETAAAAPELEEQMEVAEEAAIEDEDIANQNGFTNEAMNTALSDSPTVQGSRRHSKRRKSE